MNPVLVSGPSESHVSPSHQVPVSSISASGHENGETIIPVPVSPLTPTGSFFKLILIWSKFV
jgi:hypothetical protein